MYNVKKALNPLNTIEIFLRLKLNLKLATRRRDKLLQQITSCDM